MLSLERILNDDRLLRAMTGLNRRFRCNFTPESAQRPYGPAATQRLKQLLPVGQTITLKVSDTDRYGRTVAKIYKGNLSINLAMVQEGQAVVYRQYLAGCPELRDRLLKAEASAKVLLQSQALEMVG